MREETQATDMQLAGAEERRRKVQDDYPETPKRQKYEDRRTGASRVAQFVLNEVQTPGQGELLYTHALCGMSALTGKVVRGGRVHTQGRRSLFDCESHKKENRFSVLFFENGTSKFIDEDTSRKALSRVTFRQPWVGATFFYEDRPSGEERREVYVDTLDGLCELRLTAEEADDVREVYHESSRPWAV